MGYTVSVIKSRDDIARCFDAFKALRPHIEITGFIAQVERQRDQGYQVIAIDDGDKIVSAAGFRLAEFLAWGKILYIDDLTTLEDARGKGYAEALMDWLIAHARQEGCQALHLDTGHHRHAAHKLYLKKQMNIVSHHLSIEFS